MKYNWSTGNRDTVLKLNDLMKDTLIDQIPNLQQLKYFLQQLSVSFPEDKPNKAVLIQQVKI